MKTKLRRLIALSIILIVLLENLSKIGTKIDVAQTSGIYDYKFGQAGLTGTRIEQISREIGSDVKRMIQEIKPATSFMRSSISKAGGF